MADNQPVKISDEQAKALGLELAEAVRRGRMVDACRLVNMGANLNILQTKTRRADYSTRVVSSMSPLHWAVVKKRHEILAMLLEKNPNVNIKNHWSDTPLHTAVSKNRIDTARLLIEAGADINAVNNKGYTPLHLAVTYNQKGIVDLLKEAGADVLVRDSAGKTPALLAQLKKRKALVAILEPWEKEALRAAEARAVIEAEKKAAEVAAAEKVEPPPLKEPPPAPEPEPEPEKPSPWRKENDTTVSYTEDLPSLGRKITSLFNFKSGERCVVFTNKNNGNESINITPLSAADRAFLEEARQAFLDAGGDAALVEKSAHVLPKKVYTFDLKAPAS